MSNSSPNQAITPAVVAFELIALASPTSTQGFSLRAIMDGAAARMMIAGMTGASTGLDYSNGEVAHWMSTLLSTFYPGTNADSEWADARCTNDREGFGAAYAVRSALATLDQTSEALALAGKELARRAGGFCVLEYGYCDMVGKGPGIDDWAGGHVDRVLGRVAASPTMATPFMVFTDQRAALKSAKAEQSSNGGSGSNSPSARIAAALAMESDSED